MEARTIKVSNSEMKLKDSGKERLMRKAVKMKMRREEEAKYRESMKRV